MKCEYGKCDVDTGDEYCKGCRQNLDQHERLVKRQQRTPPMPLETPKGQTEIRRALTELVKRT